ncbi:tcdA-E operon negative regulator [Bacillus sp. UMTAT18]|uniref:hypothetical protein n=1 Tax=Bacillus TaxID=1386 RepID=UPI00061872FF|nr:MULTISPECIES: hypothetical protein [unclassified Bacillus (in: firmicutes)]KKC54358.1 tcdA-E operon negative regulator [Bacillus sp. UMTAT18]OJD70537.1 hypothetical protein BAU29_12205 [Bacillus sp. P14-1]
MFDFLSFISFIGAIFLFVMGIISILKRKGNEKKWFGLTIGCLIVWGVLVQYTNGESTSKEDREQVASAKDEETIETKKSVEIKKDEIMYFKLENITYEEDKDVVIVNANTNIPEGTIIGVSIKDEITKEIYGGNAPVKEGKLHVEIGDYEFVVNGSYKISASVPVNDANNHEFHKKYGDYQDIQKKVAVEDGEIKESSFDANDYDIEFNSLGKLEIANAYTKEEADKKSREKQKQEAKQIRYAELKKNPDKFKMEFVKYQGEILQIMESGSSTVIRLAVTKEAYGYNFNDIVYVTYDGTTQFVDKDVVTVYGRVMGSHTYESTAGYQITLPHIEAQIIE